MRVWGRTLLKCFVFIFKRERRFSEERGDPPRQLYNRFTRQQQSPIGGPLFEPTEGLARVRCAAAH